MIALFAAALAASTSPGGSAVDAERAFAQDAQRMGQWASFRKWSDHDAVIFVPTIEWARDYLKDRKEPAHPVQWTPAKSFTSCDGQVAVNSGPWTIPALKAQGRFTTIWLKKTDGWRWVYDGGETLDPPVIAPTAPVVRQASCAGHPTGAPIAPAPKMPRPTGGKPDDTGRGESGDRTLGWDWKVGPKGARTLRVFQWTGSTYKQVVDQHIAG